MINSWQFRKINIFMKPTYTSAVITTSENIICKFSTKVAVVDDGIDKELVRTVDRIAQIKRKEIKKKPQKPPFAKNIFLGIFDRDVLTFPEALDKNTVDLLEKDIVPVNDFFTNIDTCRQEKHITPEYLSNLNKLKLLGLQTSAFQGGRQLTLTETCRYLEEMSANSSRIGIVDSEQLGIQLLNKHGNEKHKKYLEELMNGKSIISFCASEGNTSAQLMETKAILSADKKSWIINGTKTLIVNGDTANLFIVFAETEELNEDKAFRKTVKAFLVERNFGGITSTPCKVMGLNQTDISNVKFENTVVPVDNLIGEVNASNKLISSTLSEYRISKGPVLTALLKNAINKFINHCIDVDSGSNNILQADAVRYKIGELAIKLYAIESTTYLTAGLLDQYENQDCNLEAAIVKMISTEYTHDCILKIMDFLGSMAYTKDHWCNKLYRNCLGHVHLNEPVDSLKLTIALMGLQHAGLSLAKTVKMLRNPLFHPGTILKRMWTHKRHIQDNPKLTLGLYEYLHPTTTTAANQLEYSVLRLQFATETVLSRFGTEVINKHVELRRLADCIADIYVTTAVLGRASRSYCIGLRHATLEMQIASVFAAQTMERVKYNVNKIWDGPYNTTEGVYLEIGKYTIKEKQYFPVHPISRNF